MITTLDDAKRFARSHGMFIVTKADFFLLYRKSEPYNICIARRKKLPDLIRTLQKASLTVA